MICIRGATTAEQNTKADILKETRVMLARIVEENELSAAEVHSIIFTATRDLDQAYPAVAARELGFTKAALMCMQEMHVENSLPLCIRVMVTAEAAGKTQAQARHMYLNKAVRLRSDLAGRRFAIAIDGPGGAGKSTVAKELARALGFTYVDTGAMYRAVAYFCIANGVDTNDEASVEKTLSAIDIRLKYKNGVQSVLVNGEDVSRAIRGQQFASGASQVAVFAAVRRKLVEIQKQMAEEEDVVMDGRDIGAYVLPDAQVKVYLYASVEERTRRRMKELERRGFRADYDTVKREIEERDYRDMHRAESPLVKAADAVELDTSGMPIPQAVAAILEMVRRQGLRVEDM